MTMRSLYAVLLRLHPRRFRERFAEEMRDVFEKARGALEAGRLMADAIASLARQWVRRWVWRPQLQLAAVDAADFASGVPMFHTFERYAPHLTAPILNFDSPERMDNDAVIALLLKLRGVGRWTAEYVLLRGLKPLNVFPGDDVGARNRLAKWLQRNEPLDYDGVARVTRNWQSYAGVVYFHMHADIAHLVVVTAQDGCLA